MIAALCVVTLLGAAQDAPTLASRSTAGFSLGIDATDFPSLNPRPPDIDPALLAFAPTSRTVALVASIATVATGVTLSTATGILLITQPAMNNVGGWSAFISGILIVSFGASVGDLLNGDVRRFVLHGLMRLGLLVVAPVLPGGLLGWSALVGLGVFASQHAPARWVERTHGTQQQPAQGATVMTF